jgi:hypothetical protein
MALVDKTKSADDLRAEIADVDPRRLSGEASADYWAKRLRMRELELRASTEHDPAQDRSE